MDLQSLQLVALAVALILTAYELRASLEPPTCPECTHCRTLAAERARRDEELATTYAHRNRLDPDDDDERRIG